MLRQKGNVFEEELLLKILGAGGNDDALPRKDRRDQIGKSLSRSRAGLNNQVLSFAQGALDGFGHRKLALAIFVHGMPLGE